MLESLKEFWPWLIPVVFVAWFVQNVVHEASHLLEAYILERRRPISFKPYPHYEDGKFYFASYSYGKARKFSETTWEIDIAPFWAGWIWGSLWLTVTVILALSDVSWWILTVPPVVTGFVDAAFFWWGYLWGSKECDGKRYRRKMALWADRIVNGPSDGGKDVSENE